MVSFLPNIAVRSRMVRPLSYPHGPKVHGESSNRLGYLDCIGILSRGTKLSFVSEHLHVKDDA